MHCWQTYRANYGCAATWAREVRPQRREMCAGSMGRLQAQLQLDCVLLVLCGVWSSIPLANPRSRLLVVPCVDNAVWASSRHSTGVTVLELVHIVFQRTIVGCVRHSPLWNSCSCGGGCEGERQGTHQPLAHCHSCAAGGSSNVCCNTVENGIQHNPMAKPMSRRSKAQTLKVTGHVSCMCARRMQTLVDS